SAHRRLGALTGRTRRRLGAATSRARRRLRRAGRTLWRRKGWVALALVLLTVAPVAAVGLWAWQVVSGVDLQRVQQASFIYAPGQPLTPGLSLEATDLAGTLRRLRYQEVGSQPRLAGQY